MRPVLPALSCDKIRCPIWQQRPGTLGGAFLWGSNFPPSHGKSPKTLGHQSLYVGRLQIFLRDLEGPARRHARKLRHPPYAIPQCEIMRIRWRVRWPRRSPYDCIMASCGIKLPRSTAGGTPRAVHSM
eukprot:1672255-Rhodomonas_salina.1